MKTILAVGFLFLVASVVRGAIDEEIMTAMKDHMDSCAAELQFSDEEVQIFVKNENLDGEMKAKSGCYSACLMKRLNLLENGMMKPENIQSVMENTFDYAPEVIPEKVEKMVKCSEKVKGMTDECELAYEFSNCYSKDN